MDIYGLRESYEKYRTAAQEGGLTPRSYSEYLETLVLFHERSIESQRRALVELLGLATDTSFEQALAALGARAVMPKGTRVYKHTMPMRVGVITGEQQLYIRYEDSGEGEWVALDELARLLA